VPRAWLLSVFPYTLLCADAVQLAFVHEMVGRFNIVGDENSSGDSNLAASLSSSTSSAMVAKSKAAPKADIITATPRFVCFRAGNPAVAGSTLQVEFAVDIHGDRNSSNGAQSVTPPQLDGSQPRLVMSAPGTVQHASISNASSLASSANSPPPPSSTVHPSVHHGHDHHEHEHEDVFVPSAASDALLSALLFDHAAARHTAIVGDKGAGKSALVRHLARLTRPVLSASAATAAATSATAAASLSSSLSSVSSSSNSSPSSSSTDGSHSSGDLSGVVHVYLYKDMTVRELLQRRVTDGAGNTRWEMGPLARAALSGALVVLDGLDRLSSATVRGAVEWVGLVGGWVGGWVGSEQGKQGQK
jgi:hypothetical protein